ncbi:ABC transporter substrate-binding protein [Azospirillum agricola]|uniref:ABC transporter substrate-binding protein n=1 Tax=Azospirillum agricola TaxID=1720247 RepID=UPI000A0F126A|nr:ABC transporter substrate-binding protein [Azospirillum agricola]SMH62790.1 amino acid/amide ABC transporter substrate-binding protein, HAAT family [Azospirillum lipoferum]
MGVWTTLARMATVTVFGALAAGTALALAAGAALAQDTVTIGYTGPLSGGAALYGKNTLSGLEIAAKDINAAGGFTVAGKTYKVNVVALDDKYSPSESAVNAKRLKAQYGAPIVFVPHSGGAFALQAFNEQDNFIVAAYTSVPNITERGNTLTLRIPPSFLGYIDPFVRVEMATFGKKLAIANADHDYAKAWTKAFVPVWEKAGGTVVADNPLSYNKDTDFYSGVSRVLAASPDVMLVGGASEPTALLIRQARELGFQGGFAIMDQAKLDEMARIVEGFTLLEGSVGVMPLVHDRRPGAEAFVAKYRKLFNKDPGSEVSYNYTALNAVTEAMTLAGTVSDPKAIRAKLNDAYAALPSERNPARITGVDANGGSNAKIIVGFVEKGVIVPIDAATGQ